MSFIVRRMAARPLVRPAANINISSAVRPFSGSCIRPAGQESSLQHEGRAEEIDASNKEQLKKQKEGKGEWTSKLASDSESIVKADRGEIKATEDNIRKLQEETEKIASKSK